MWFLVINNRQKVSWGAVTLSRQHTKHSGILFYHAHVSPLDFPLTYSANDCWCSTLNEGGTTFVLSQRQQRLDRLAIRRRITTNKRLDRQRQQRQRQQQVRDQNQERCRSSRAELTPEQLEFRREGGWSFGRNKIEKIIVVHVMN